MLRPEYIVEMLRVFGFFRNLMANYFEQFVSADLLDVCDYLYPVQDKLIAMDEGRVRRLKEALSAIADIRSNILSARDTFRYFIDRHRFMCDDLKATLSELERGEITERATKLKIEEITDETINRVRNMVRTCEQSFTAYHSLFIEFSSFVDALVSLCNSYEEFFNEIGKAIYIHPSEVKKYVEGK